MERVINSLSGSNIQLWTPSSNAPYSLVVEDQLRNYVMTTPDWYCRFGVNQARTRVMLRYDESKAKFHPNWTLSVRYDIKLYNSGSSIPFATLQNEIVQINYDQLGAGYIDTYYKTYENASRAELTITQVQSPGLALSAANDVFLDLVQETERFYNLFYPNCLSNTPPVLNVAAKAPSFIQQSGNSGLQYPIAWNYIEGAESYDVEWLFVDVGAQAPGLNGNYAGDFPVDFRNATRINTKSQSYNIPLAYPKGYVLYRVRPVGRTSHFPYLDRTEGDWSAYSTNGLVSGITSPNGSDFKMAFDGLDESHNWQYTAAYAEDGKHKEIISYFDGSLRNRQTSTLLSSDNTALVAETKYDFQGRGSVQMLPVPVPSTGLHYYNDFTNFGKQQFDIDANFPVANAAVSTANAVGNYYSNNSSATGQEALVPDAQGFPYAQTLYLQDGTGRVKAQSMPGPMHKLGSLHETKYYYGTPGSQAELDRLFGIEVGNLSHYKKNLVLDPNGQVSVSYLDQEGRVIATALSSSPVHQNLLSLDDRPAPVWISSDILTGRNDLMNDARVSRSTILVDAPAKAYRFQYDLNLNTPCESPCPAQTYCADCSFDLQIRVTDANGALIPATITGSSNAPSTPAPGSISGCQITPALSQLRCSNISSASYLIEINFPDIGSYVIEKSIRINYGQLDAYANKYVETFLSCETPTVIPPKPCNNCDTLCNRQHIRHDAFGHVVYKNPPLNTIPVYTDLYGAEIPVPPNDPNFTAYQANGLALIAQCTGDCKNAGTSTGPSDECALRRVSLAADMSPGGQYFDNLPSQFPPCGSTSGCSSTPVTTTGINDWLLAKIAPDEASAGSNPFWSDFRAFVASYNTNSPPGSSNHLGCLNASALPAYPNLTWNWLRANWKACFGQQLMKYHPEYNLFMYFCDNGRTICPKNGGIAVTLLESRNFDKAFMAGTAASYFNPASATGQTNNSFSNPASATQASFASYVSDLATTPGYGPAPSTKDPYLSNTTCNTSCANGTQYLPMTVMSDYLQQFFTAHDCPSCYSGSTVISNTCSACPAIPMSIWYVLDDPHHIAQNGADAFALAFPSNPTLSGIRLDPLTVSLFRQYHGYGSTPGLLAQGGKFTVFKAIYAAYKQIIYAAGMKAYGINYLEPDPQQQVAANCCHSLPHAQIRFQQDPIVRQMQSTCPPSIANLNNQQFVNDQLSHPTPAECTSTCESYATIWMNDINNKALQCNPAVVLSPADKTTLRSYLVQICAGSCDGTHPEGTSSTTLTIGPGLHTFDDVYNYFFNNPSQFPAYTCSSVLNGVVSHPPQPYSQAACICDGLKDLAQQSNISWSSPTLATSLRSSMINNLGVDPADVLPGDVQAWINTCNSAAPDLQVLLNNNGHPMPEVLLCPDDSPLTPANGCDQAQQDATYQTTVYQQQFFENLRNTYRTTYKTKCLDGLLTNESLTAAYSLDEFAYTLYYYDQAGNLIKTVPPKGVHPIEVSNTPGTNGNVTTKDVANYRSGASRVKVWPAHTHITNYKYNSQEGITKQITPDGGLTRYWYDDVRRLVASQNARQSTDKYAYTVYDKLSRIVEVGEFTNTALGISEIANTAWLAAGTGRHQVTKTWYDERPDMLSMRGESVFNTSGMMNLRNRVSSVTYVETPGGFYSYDNAIHYRYDMHGNVCSQFRENIDLFNDGNEISRTDYEYDIISGKVNKVHHNPGKLDEFHHRYEYDADNRITAVYTSRDAVLWEKDAKYYYYKHGPLRRSELGDRQVQASDYAYTLNGWLKGVNSNEASSARDIGRDADNNASNPNRFFGEDAYGYTLGYFNGDYISRNPAAGAFIAGTGGIAPLLTDINTSKEVYNGNISHMATTIKSQAYTGMPQLRGFLYDQLNRIRWSKALNSLSSNSWTGGSYLSDHQEEFHYDLNGNITRLARNGTGGTLMDNMTYAYTGASNRLRYVRDLAPATNYTDDIDDQLSSNYDYDAIGNLIKDEQQKIGAVEWNVYGKIKSITKPYANQSDLEFKYDGLGNRIEKIVKPRNASGALTGASTTTHYIRDAQGNIMAVYERNATGLMLMEQDIYGSSRLGLANNTNQVLSSTNNGFIVEWSMFNSTANGWSPTTASSIPSFYGDGTIRVDVSNMNDGLEKTISTGQGVPYVMSFDADLINVPAYNISILVLDGTTGQRLNTLTSVLDGYNCVPFTAVSNSVVIKYLNNSNDACTFSLDNIYIKLANRQRKLGNKQYELTNHLGNVLSTITDRRIQEKGFDANGNGLTEYYSPQIMSATDYYAFGAPMPGRNVNNTYRYGFNGKPKDDEIAGAGNSLDFGARVYDSRLGRWLSLDPLQSIYPSLSPYNFVANSPFIYIDPDGKTIQNAEIKGTYRYDLMQSALDKVHKNNKELYELLDNSPIIIKVMFADIAEHQEKIELNGRGGVTTHNLGGTIVPADLRGLSIPEYEIDRSIDQNDALVNITYDKNKNPTGAQIKRRPTLEEITARYEKGEDQQTPIIMTDIEASKYIKIKSVTIKIDPDLNSTKQKRAQTIGHELGHAKFSIFNTVKDWIWEKLSKKEDMRHGPNDPSGVEANTEGAKIN